jgi:hypothetical protein
LAGERAAYARAFSFAVPSQQALGQLFGAVEQLHARLESDARAVRDVQLAQARDAAALELAVQRIVEMERGALPELQRKWEEVATRPALSPVSPLAAPRPAQRAAAFLRRSLSCRPRGPERSPWRVRTVCPCAGGG